MPGDRRDTGSDAERYRFEPGQFVYNGRDLTGVRSLRIENCLDVIEDYEHLPGCKGRS